MEVIIAAERSHDPISRVSLCYQCKKCSSGCPVSFTMDLKPHQVMRLIQIGSNHRILEASTIWVCSSCFTCSARCPNDIDIAGVMDRFRQIAIREKSISDKPIERFHRVFLKEISQFGRIHELSMIAKYKLLTGKLFKDNAMGIKMFLKGKLKVLPKWINGKKEIRKLFKDAGQQG